MPFNNSRINVSAQREMVRRHGEFLDYYTSMKCTCTLLPTGAYMPDANRADPNCVACKGLGIVWTFDQKIVAVVMNINQQKDLIQAGIAAPGDLILSTSPQYTISDYDKIRIDWRDGIPYEGQLVTRSSSSVTDDVNYEIVKIVTCASVDPVTGDVTKYTPDIDFTFSGNTVTWISNNAPPAGSTYSIKYAAVIDWICFAPPQPRRERGTDLGQRIVMRKKHLITFGG